MTAQSKDTVQKRLRNCVLSPPKWAKTHEKIENHAYRTVKISYLGADATRRVEITRENGQGRHNLKLLGKYPLKHVSSQLRLSWTTTPLVPFREGTIIHTSDKGRGIQVKACVNDNNRLEWSLVQ